MDAGWIVLGCSTCLLEMPRFGCWLDCAWLLCNMSNHCNPTNLYLPRATKPLPRSGCDAAMTAVSACSSAVVSVRTSSCLACESGRQSTIPWQEFPCDAAMTAVSACSSVSTTCHGQVLALGLCWKEVITRSLKPHTHEQQQMVMGEWEQSGSQATRSEDQCVLSSPSASFDFWDMTWGLECRTFCLVGECAMALQGRHDIAGQAWHWEMWMGALGSGEHRLSRRLPFQF